MGGAWVLSITVDPSIFQPLKSIPYSYLKLLSLSELVLWTDDNHRLTSHDDLLIDHSLVPLSLSIHPLNKLFHQFVRPSESFFFVYIHCLLCLSVASIFLGIPVIIESDFLVRCGQNIWHAWGRTEMHEEVLWGNVKERNHVEDIGHERNGTC